LHALTPYSIRRYHDFGKNKLFICSTELYKLYEKFKFFSTSLIGSLMRQLEINIIIIIIISLLMSLLLGHRPFLWITHKENHNPHGPSRDQRLNVPSEARRNRDNKFLVTHLITDQRCLTAAIARRSALTTGPSSS
jgi:hypothetical protein